MKSSVQLAFLACRIAPRDTAAMEQANAGQTGVVDSSSKSGSLNKLALALLLLVALLVRVADVPHRYELRHVDELPYVGGSLQLLEGMVPPYKYSPAGPQTWIGWAYAGALSAKYMVRPTGDELAVDKHVRPFTAVNHALWDCYADLSTLRLLWILAALPIALWAVVEMYKLGAQEAGLAGAVLGGGIVALLPLLVKLGSEGRPYAMGWSFAIIAMALTLRRTDARARWWSAIALGLAIASRIDMVMALPVVWSGLWTDRRDSGSWRRLVRYHIIVAITALLVAPWILTNLIGNLRIIATVRLATPPGGPIPLSQTIRDIAWNQGLWLIPLLAIVGAFLPRRNTRWPRVFLGVYVLFLALSMLKATAFGLQHQGGPLVVLLVVSAFALRPLTSRPAIAWVIALAALVLPAVQTVCEVIADRRGAVDDGPAIAWIEHNIPAGTRLYTTWAMQNPLPTLESGDRAWAELHDGHAWQDKFLSGMERFKITNQNIPRALSEENMLVEIGNRRVWFILAGRGDVGRPRYDIAPLSSPVLGLRDLKGAFAKTGGVILWRGPFDDPAISGLTPTKQWVSPDGKKGAFVFCSSDMKLVQGEQTKPATQPSTSP